MTSSWIGTGAADAPNKGVDRTKNLSDLSNIDSARENLGVQRAGDGHRNRITNPCMQLSQENGDTAGTSTLYYAADQFVASFITSAGAVSTQRIASVTPAGAEYRYRLSVTTADTSLASNEYLRISTKIEGYLVRDFNWGTANANAVILRFIVNAPAGTYSVSLKNPNVWDRSYVAEYTVSAPDANTDTLIELPIAGETTGTWATTNAAGIEMNFVFAVNTTKHTLTPNSWVTGDYDGTASTTNGLGAVQTFEIGDIGLKLDPDSTGVYGEFEVPDYTQNELASMRYYWEGEAIGRGETYKAWVSGSYYSAGNISPPVNSRTTTPSWSIVTAPTYADCTNNSLERDYSGGAIHTVDPTSDRFRAYRGVYARNDRM